MDSSSFFSVAVCLLFASAVAAELLGEPVCSKFHFEEKVLEKLVRIEHKLQLQEERMSLWEKTIDGKIETLRQTEERANIILENVKEKGIDPDDLKLDELLSDMHISETPKVSVIKLHRNVDQHNLLCTWGFELPPPGSLKGVEEVVFSALASRSMEHLQLQHKIKFDEVILNKGGGYSPNSGVFTAPTPGTYLFLYHLGRHGVDETWVQITKNGEKLNGVAVEGTTHSQNLQGSNSVVLYLKQEDEVWVEIFHVNNVSLSQFFTTFSGVRLH